MATEAQVAAIAAALSVYLEAEVQVKLAEPIHPWGWAARNELIGATPRVSAIDQLPTKHGLR